MKKEGLLFFLRSTTSSNSTDFIFRMASTKRQKEKQLQKTVSRHPS